MDWFIVVALLALGWLLLFLEIFFIPGITVLIIVGALMMTAGILFSFMHYGAETGWWTVVGTLTVVVGTLAFASRSKFWSKLSLHDENSARMNVLETELVKPGARGKAISRIAPSGTAMFADKMFEVHSESGFLNQNTEVEVVRIYLNRIIVKPVNT